MRSYLVGHHSGVFDDNDTRLLCAAFDEAWQLIQDAPHIYSRLGDPSVLREMVASQIVAAAMNGERDPVRLRTAGLLQVAVRESRHG